jgi:DNA-binding transcriptional LysR family regulator
MDNKKYEVFLLVADCGNLSRAAEQLSYTQSGVTRIISSLEQDLGFELLIRTNKGVRLTPEGQQLLPLFRDIQSSEERLRQECARIHGLEEGNIRIGCFPSISSHWMPEIIARFQSQHPNINVEMLEEDARQLDQWLSEGRIDLCFFSLHSKQPYERINLVQDPFYAVLPSEHPLTALESIPLVALSSEPFIMYNTPAGPDKDIENVLNSQKLSWNFKYSSNNDNAVLSMVAHNLGVTILPSLVLKEHTQNVVTRPLLPSFSRTLGIAMRSLEKASPAMRHFISCAKSTLLFDDQINIYSDHNHPNNS